jgi:hypothetical protein
MGREAVRTMWENPLRDVFQYRGASRIFKVYHDCDQLFANIRFSFNDEFLG